MTIKRLNKYLAGFLLLVLCGSGASGGAASAIDSLTNLSRAVFPGGTPTYGTGMSGLMTWTSIGTKTISTGSTTTTIETTTAHNSRVGDMIIVTSSSETNLQDSFSPILSVTDTDTFVVAYPFPSAPANGNTIRVLRPRIPQGADGGTGINGMFVSLLGGSGTVILNEDQTHNESDPVLAIGFKREDSLSVDTNADGDAGMPRTDKFGMVLTQAAPPASWFKCVSTADIEDTASTAITGCTADASNLFNITNLSVDNTDATVGTRVDFLDGATVIYSCVVGAGAATNNNCGDTFWPPLRAAAVNTALNCQAATTSAKIRCKASGFKTPS